MEIFRGVCTAIVTPFDKNNKINYKIFRKLINFQIKNKINAIVFLGTTGEASTLTEVEKENIIKFAVKIVNKRIPVIVGAGGNCTSEAIIRAKAYEKLGVDALLEVTPYYNKCTQSGLIQHFTKIAHSVNIPIILYNVPSRTGVNIEPKTVLELSAINNIVGIKEASGNLQQLTELAQILPNDFAIYSGDDTNIFTTLALGGKGVISVVSNLLPKETCEIANNFFNGNYKKAREKQFKLLPIIKNLFAEVNPIPIKASLKIIGYNVGLPRLPLTKLTENNYQNIKNKLKIIKNN